MLENLVPNILVTNEFIINVLHSKLQAVDFISGSNDSSNIFSRAVFVSSS
jgi:hypothetical protein